jgi:hypothetical protein
LNSRLSIKIAAAAKAVHKKEPLKDRGSYRAKVRLPVIVKTEAIIWCGLNQWCRARERMLAWPWEVTTHLAAGSLRAATLK